jgi:hypothetical protein
MWQLASVRTRSEAPSAGAANNADSDRSRAAAVAARPVLLAALGDQNVSADRAVTLQISMFPLDEPHIEHILAHQLRVWAGQVDEILVTIDVHRSRAGRYRGDDFEEKLGRLRRLLERQRRIHPSLRIEEIDYAAASARAVAAEFFGGGEIPVKAWDGGPFYAYFFALHIAWHRYVLHLDSDMMFGGGSQRWMAEATGLLAARPDILVCSPHPGPPRPDGTLIGNPGEPEPFGRATFRFPGMSTRIFLIDRQRLVERIGALRFAPLPRAKAWKARLLGNPAVALEAEIVISQAMQRCGLSRIDLLGSGEGMWSIHPPFRSEAFYATLPALIRRIERGEMPEAQCGDYNMNDSMIDWSAPRRAHAWPNRMLRHLTQLCRRGRDAFVDHP